MRARSAREPAAAPAAARASADPGSSAARSAPPRRRAGRRICGARIRRTVESDVASAQASAGDLASARLSAQGTLASDYLQLRMSDELKRLFDAAAGYYAESLRITRNQYQSGTTDQSAVAQAEAQLESTQAQAIAVGVTRAQLEHAIAVLIGKPPAEFSIAPAEARIAVPVIPPEHAVGAAGAPPRHRRRRAADGGRQCPDRRRRGRVLSRCHSHRAITGLRRAILNRLLATSSRFWSFGSNLVQTVFDAGARSAQVEEAARRL